MKKIAVFGCGVIGSAIIKDLSDDFEVTAVDIDDAALEKAKKSAAAVEKADFSDADKVASIARANDFVVGAVPGFLGFKLCETVLKSGRSMADVSFFPEDAELLDPVARETGTFVALDCGLAPGTSNMILGREVSRMRVKKFLCYVGGLPKIRTKPFEYKAPFSPVDVIEEYSRPAKFVEKGHVIVKEAMSETELVDFEGIGTLEAFLTDGLRTLIKSYKIPEMKEKTLRYPGHAELIKTLKRIGFFSRDPIEIDGAKIRPIDLTSKLLTDNWKLEPGEKEFTVMKIIIEGFENGDKKRLEYFMRDDYDEKSGETSMARTTAFVVSATVRLAAEGKIKGIGVIPPEKIGENAENFEYVMNYLKERNVVYSRRETLIK